MLKMNWSLIFTLVSFYFSNVSAFSTNSPVFTKLNRLRLQMSTKLTSSPGPKMVGGSHVALVTPMKDGTNEIDYDALDSLVEMHLKAKTDGIVVLGTTGESPSISPEERKSIISRVVSLCSRSADSPFITVGVGCSSSLALTIALCEEARALGAHGVLALPPCYVKPPARAIYAHMCALADKSPLPVVLYNCPGRTGARIDVETAARLSLRPNILALKDADAQAVERVAQIRARRVELARAQDAQPGEFLLLSGEDNLTADFCLAGGHGVVSVTANALPEQVRRITQLAVAGDAEAARRTDAPLADLHRDLFVESNPIPVKRLLQLMGLIEGGIRPPLCKLDDALLPTLLSAARKAGIKV